MEKLSYDLEQDKYFDMDDQEIADEDMLSSIKKERLDKALNASAVSFRSLKAAYDNLLPLGSPEELPEPSGLLPEVISFVTMNVFYTRLGEAERYFKSQIPEDADSPYAIFWEDTI